MQNPSEVTIDIEPGTIVEIEWFNKFTGEWVSGGSFEVPNGGLR